MARSAKSIEKSIKRLERELAELDDFFYMQNKAGDRLLHQDMLEHKRDDFVRGAVLQLHTSIEDILSGIILSAMLGVPAETRFRAKGVKADAMRRLLKGGGSMGFDAKLSLAVGIGIIKSSVRDQLAELNTIRNKCSHNWLLRVPVRRGKRPAQKKPPLLLFRGKDLHKVQTFKDFTAEYGLVYAKLFGLLYTGRYSAK